jgi:hypothetical protein
MPKKRLFWQLYSSNFLIVFLALFAFTFLTTSSINTILLRQVSADLKARAKLLEDVVREHIADSSYALHSSRDVCGSGRTAARALL